MKEINLLGTGHLDMVISIESPGFNSKWFLPSNAADAEQWAEEGTLIFSFTVEGNTTGRNVREWGQIGVTKIAGSLFFFFLNFCLFEHSF